ncbi:MAG: hypothetical protein LBF23_00340 [Endomicrobium sp.]|jgi:hypothetical protein|nr:hypothetical protein [Endomicrobium sp.]
MEPSTNTKKKKWIVLGVIIAVLAILVAVGPVIISKYMRSSKAMRSTITASTAEFMIKVKGIIKEDTAKELLYLKGDNGLYYILVSEKPDQIKANLNKNVTIFGNILAPDLQNEAEKVSIDGNSVRMSIGVVKVEVQ